MMLGLQIVTGIILAMHYVPHVDYAFRVDRADHAPTVNLRLG